MDAVHRGTRPSGAERSARAPRGRPASVPPMGLGSARSTAAASGRERCAVGPADVAQRAVSTYSRTSGSPRASATVLGHVARRCAFHCATVARILLPATGRGVADAARASIVGVTGPTMRAISRTPLSQVAISCVPRKSDTGRWVRPARSAACRERERNARPIGHDTRGHRRLDRGPPVSDQPPTAAGPPATDQAVPAPHGRPQRRPARHCRRAARGHRWSCAPVCSRHR